MNKKLRFSFMAVLMAFCGAVSAQDIIWQEDWTGYEDKEVPSTRNSNYSETGTNYNEDGTFKSGTRIYATGDQANLAGGQAPELLVAQSGGSFTATVNLGGRSGSTTLAWMANRKDLKVTITGATESDVIALEDATASGNNYSLTFDIPSGYSTLTITFTNASSKNIRLDEIKLYQGSAKKPAGLSWGTSTRTVYLGANDNQFPTLQNDNQLNIDFNSTDPTVATISPSGEITLLAVGKTDITATFYGDDEYEAQTASYALTVKEAKDETQYTVTEALDIIDKLADGAKTDKDYYVKGTVTEIKEISTDNGNASFYISDGSKTLYIFRAKGLEKKNITDENYLKVNDEVVVYGKLQKYVDKNNDNAIVPEMTSGGYIYELNGKTTDENGGEQQQEETKTATVAEFIAAEVSTNVWYQLTGTISELKEGDQYGNFYLTDATGSVYVYGVLSEKGGDKQKFQELVAAQGIKNGSKITIIGNRGYYAKEDKIEVMNAYFVSVDNSGAIDPQTYEVNVAEALTKAGELEEGKESIDTYIVSGYIVGKPVAERKEDGTLYGNFNFVIADQSNGTDVLTIYHCKGKNNEAITDETENMIKAGDFVKLQGKLKKFVKDDVTTLELVSGFIVEVTPSEIKRGDANGDDKIDVRDMAYILEAILNGTTDQLSESADVNNDNKIDVRDMATLLEIILGN